MLIVGVGGQGTILASRILGELFLGQDYDVKISEIHGMSQRGGSVVTQVRFAHKDQQIASPIIEQGTADIILAFEKLEALRYLSWLKKDGIMIINDQRIDPMPVVTGAVSYPEGITEQLSAAGRLIVVDALQKAEQAGNSKSVNVVLLGVLSNHLDISEPDWFAALSAAVAPRFFDVNMRAFALGRES